MRYGGPLQICYHGAHGIGPVLMRRRTGRHGLGIGHYLELVRLQDSPQRVEEHGSIVWGPQVHINRVDPIHVLALVVGIWSRKMPLGRVLLRR